MPCTVARQGEGCPSRTSSRHLSGVSDSGSSSKHPQVCSVSESWRRGCDARCTHSFIYTRTQAHSSRHIHTHTLICVHTYRHIRTCSHVCTLSTFTHTRAHSLPLICACMHADAHTPVHSHAISHMHVFVQTRTRGLSWRPAVRRSPGVLAADARGDCGP